MKKSIIIVLFALMLTVIPLTGCGFRDIDIEGEYITKEYTDLEGTSIDIHSIYVREGLSGVPVVVRFDGKSRIKSIKVKACEGLFEYLDVKNKKDEIVISAGTRDTYNTEAVEIEINGFEFKAMDFEFCDAEIDLYSCNKFCNLNASAASTIRLSYFNGEELHANINSASKLTINTMTATKFDLKLSAASKFNGVDIEMSDFIADLSAASSATIYGGTGELGLDCSSSSVFDAENLRCDKANVRLSTASSATISVSTTLGYDLSTGSYLIYVGSPEVIKDEVSTGSKVDKRLK